ncbi:hypothetical protein LZ31DRAFT_1358 [Colletotrichum somersetense]|nr:hypothetical protein LZ31DRAFT_1358 [Colletotrichum somersetense]
MDRRCSSRGGLAGGNVHLLVTNDSALLDRGASECWKASAVYGSRIGAQTPKEKPSRFRLKGQKRCTYLRRASSKLSRAKPPDSLSYVPSDRCAARPPSLRSFHPRDDPHCINCGAPPRGQAQALSQRSLLERISRARITLPAGESSPQDNFCVRMMRVFVRARPAIRSDVGTTKYIDW